MAKSDSRTCMDAIGRLKTRASWRSRELGRKISVVAYTQELRGDAEMAPFVDEFDRLVESLRNAAAELGPSSCANVFAFDVDGSDYDIRVVLEGDSEFLLENRIGLFTLADLGAGFSRLTGYDVHVRSQPRASWCTQERIDAYEREKVVIWERGDGW